MSEKIVPPSRFLFYLITIFLFLLIFFSSVSLLQFSRSSLISGLVFKQSPVNNTSSYLKSYAAHEPGEISLPSELHEEDSSRNEGGGCSPHEAQMRVFMYDLPPEFHFGLLGWKGSAKEMWPSVNDPSQIPPYPGGLNLQHSIEYWLTLDLLASNAPNIVRPCTAVRVENSSQADVVFVPFFSSLSYNRYSKLNGKEKVSVNKLLQSRLVHFLTGRNEWRKRGGKDHIILAHHPNSMLDTRKTLGSAMFVLADFGRYPTEIANLEKDIIAPYRHVVRTIPSNQSAPFEERPILAYFQGAIYRKDGGFIRQELYYLLKDEKDVHFAFGSIKGNGMSKAGQGMSSSKFCLNIAGDTPSSNRLFDAIVNHCVPVIISDDIELPFEDVLDYSDFCIFVHASNAVRKGYLVNFLRRVKKDRWTAMWERLKEVVKHFEYQYPSGPSDAVDMIWQAVHRKISGGHINLLRNARYRKSQLLVKGH